MRQLSLVRAFHQAEGLLCCLPELTGPPVQQLASAPQNLERLPPHQQLVAPVTAGRGSQPGGARGHGGSNRLFTMVQIDGPPGMTGSCWPCTDACGRLNAAAAELRSAAQTHGLLLCWLARILTIWSTFSTAATASGVLKRGNAGDGEALFLLALALRTHNACVQRSAMAAWRRADHCAPEAGAVQQAGSVGLDKGYLRQSQNLRAHAM